MEESIKQEIKSFIVQEFHIKEPSAITDEMNLLEFGPDSGLFDSLGVLSLIGFLETNFQISLDEKDLQREHFSTVRSMAALVSRKKES